MDYFVNSALAAIHFRKAGANQLAIPAITMMPTLTDFFRS